MNKPEPYKYVPHTFEFSVGGKQICSGCGLVRLNNEFTEWAIDKGCMNKVHSSYNSKRKLTNPFKEK